MPRLLVRSEHATHQAVRLGATARLVLVPTAELAGLLLQLRPHLPLDRGARDVGLQGHRVLDAGEVGAADLEEFVAASDAKPTDAADGPRDLVVAGLSHGSAPVSLAKMLASKADECLE